MEHLPILEQSHGRRKTRDPGVWDVVKNQSALPVVTRTSDSVWAIDAVSPTTRYNSVASNG